MSLKLQLNSKSEKPSIFYTFHSSNWSNQIFDLVFKNSLNFITKSFKRLFIEIASKNLSTTILPSFVWNVKFKFNSFNSLSFFQFCCSNSILLFSSFEEDNIIFVIFFEFSSFPSLLTPTMIWLWTLLSKYKS